MAAPFINTLPLYEMTVWFFWRAVIGPQEDAFTKQGLDTLIRSPFRLARTATAWPVAGGRIHRKKEWADIISDGIAEGSVQISSDRFPCFNGRPSDYRRICKNRHGDQHGYSRTGSVKAGEW